MIPISLIEYMVSRVTIISEAVMEMTISLVAVVMMNYMATTEKTS